MGPSDASIAGLRPRWLAGLFGLAALAVLPVFATVVWPVISFAARPAHAGHWPLVLLHAIAGTMTVILGFVGLYIGWTRRGFAWHRHVGCYYIGFGLTMSACALWLSILSPHAPHSLSVSTGTLAIVWSVAACMGWRAGAHRRYGAHRDWMIRSFVLTWTFVFCRLAQRGDLLAGLGPEALTAGIWLYWVGPLLLTEVALQWRRGGPIPHG